MGGSSDMNSWFNTCSALTVPLAVRLVEQRFRAAFEKPSPVSSPSEAALFACERSREVEEL